MIVDSVLSDVSGISPEVLLWQDCFSVLKHGGHAIVICGVSNYHRVACAMEDSGFEIRDSIMWVYSSDDGEFSSAVEPIVLARKPLIGSIADNVVKYGTGGINIDGCRVGWASESDAAVGFAESRARVTVKQSPSIGKESRDGINRYHTDQMSGRWPANFIHDGSEDVVGLFPNVKGGNWNSTQGARPFNNNGAPTGYETTNSDSSVGSAARFFYCAPRDSNDTSTKPLGLLRYLCRLITPPNGIVFDPFPNAQTPIEEAAKAEGFSYKRG